jgi:hypothetical protein
MTTETTEQNTFLDFELFQKVFGIKIVSIGLECPSCKRIWGFKVTDEKNIAEVKQGKLVCYHCTTIKKNAESG